MKRVCFLMAVLAFLPGVCAAQSQKDAQATQKLQIDIDSSQAPDLKDWAEKELKPVLETWYPIIIADLPSEGFVAPRHFTVTIIAGGRGIADTSGTSVRVFSDWIKSQRARGPQNEAIGSVVHEAVHVAQQYGGARGGHPVPGWMTEGIADYIRWWKYEPASVRRPVSPVKRNGQPASYTDAYQTTAAFLEYVAKNWDHEIVVKMNAAGRDGTYSPDLWKTYTGKSVDELWTLFVETLTKK